MFGTEHSLIKATRLRGDALKTLYNMIMSKVKFNKGSTISFSDFKIADWDQLDSSLICGHCSDWRAKPLKLKTFISYANLNRHMKLKHTKQ